MPIRQSIIIAPIIMLFSQAWFGTLVDALTESHYWHTVRSQFEHVPDNAEDVSFNFTGNSLDDQRIAWKKDPCPVPNMLNRTSTAPDKFNRSTDIFSDFEKSLVPYPLPETKKSILTYAPKQSPPMA